MGDIKQKLTQLAEQAADAHGVEIFDIELLGKGKLLLRVLIDKESGVTLDDCQHFSKSFSALLDVEDPLQGSYNLEVSSPGMDRPLKRLIDFEKNTGKLARIVTVDKIDNRNFFIGRISSVDKNIVKLMIKEYEIPIPFEKISKARLEIEL
ncbi:MAG: ribosome maturation factor RimP [Thermodesulfovibrionales bacterium]